MIRSDMQALRHRLDCLGAENIRLKEDIARIEDKLHEIAGLEHSSRAVRIANTALQGKGPILTDDRIKSWSHLSNIISAREGK